MTNTSAGKSKTKDPRNWRVGKQMKKADSTNRYIRRTVKRMLNKNEEI
jgi:hypothetical protein